MKTADKDYYLDAKGKATTDAKKAESLLVRKGAEISPEMQAEYFGEKARTETTKATAPAENKAATPSAAKKTK